MTHYINWHWEDSVGVGMMDETSEEVTVREVIPDVGASMLVIVLPRVCADVDESEPIEDIGASMLVRVLLGVSAGEEDPKSGVDMGASILVMLLLEVCAGMEDPKPGADVGAGGCVLPNSELRASGSKSGRPKGKWNVWTAIGP